MFQRRPHLVVSHSLAMITVLLCLGCGTETPPDEVTAPAPPPPPSSHERMREALRQIAEESREINDFVGDRKVRELRVVLDDPIRLASLSPFSRWSLYYELGRRELRQGHELEAIQLLETALQTAEGGVKQNNALKKTWFELGMANLRHGETQNCCSNNNSDSCIVPIRGGGLHTKPLGSRTAIQFFQKVLSKPASPQNTDEALELDGGARWLLNIAYMTLGEYPDKVPKQYLVDPSFFESEVEFPRFINIYPRLGLRTFNLCGGAVVDDFDGDHDLDIVTCTWDTSGQTQVFENLGNGKIVERTEESGLLGFYGGLNLNQADYDNDGDLDLYIMRGAWLKESGRHPDSLLRNDGNLKFTDVTFDAGLGEHSYPNKTSCWADYDNDGDLDLFVGNETSEEQFAPCQLFRNNGNGTFTDVAEQAGVQACVFMMGAVWGDYNNDRYPDLYLSVTGRNILYKNNRDGTFTDVAEDLKVTEPGPSFATWFWDYNNDGHLDIFVGCTSGTVGVLATDIRFELMKLYENQGNEAFREVSAERSLTYPASPMGANFGDLQNDGFSDLYLATGNVPFSEIQPNVMFTNQNGEKFVNVTMAGGFGHLQKGHAVSFADIDNDGDQDVYVQLGGAYPGDRFNDALFENPGFGNRWVMLHLQGIRSNRSAIGARVRIQITENGKQRSVYHHVTSGSSFGANPLQQTLGLGRAKKIDRLEVYWPTSDTTDVFENVAVDQALKVVEGSPTLTPIQRTTFKLGASPKPGSSPPLSLTR